MSTKLTTMPSIIRSLSVILLCLSLSALDLLGQDSMPDSFAMYGNGKAPIFPPSLKAVDSVLLDTALLTIRYRAFYKMYPESSSNWHVAMLHVGSSHSLFYDFTGHIKNRYSYIQQAKVKSLHWSDEEGVEESIKELRERVSIYGDLGTFGSYFYRSVMYDRRTGKSKVVVPDIWAPTQPYGFYELSLAHVYEEDVPELEWEITGEHGTVASFDCQKAECDFRGRRWEAWFTTEIPFSEGPWKFRGLPGLILYARDTTGQYSFEATSVTDEPVPFYDYAYEQEKRTAYRKFKRYERSCFRWPKSFNENTSVFIVTGNGIEEADYQNWRMPYYPMEW